MQISSETKFNEHNNEMVVYEISVKKSEDPLSIVCNELQSRVGDIPKIITPVELYASPTFIFEPKSYSEICRVVRAAKTMRLSVRACGAKSSDWQAAIFGQSSQCSVILDCRFLRDQPEISKVYIRRKGIVGEEPGLRVLAGVGMNKLINFLVHNCCQLEQSFDMHQADASVVAGVITSKPGIALHQDPYAGSCLGDEVICLRMIDSEGDLVEYSSEEELKYAVTNYGTLGVLYDLTFRYANLGICQVNHEYIRMTQLMDTRYLSQKITKHCITELIYIPMNQANDDEPWEPLNDLVLLKTAVSMPSEDKETEEPLTSEPRFKIPMIDPVFGPSEECYFDARKCINDTKLLLQGCFEYQRREIVHKPSVRLFTPWALNSTLEVPYRTRHFTLSTLVPTGLQNFGDIMKKICVIMRNHANERLTFPLNVGMKINFTRQNLHDIEDPLECKNLQVHFKFMALASVVYDCRDSWTSFTRDILESVQSVARDTAIQWSSDWPSMEIMVENQRTLFNSGSRLKLKKECARVDRYGMFLNEVLEQILIPDEMSSYQKIYRTKKF